MSPDGSTPVPTGTDDLDGILSVERPHPNLLIYYGLSSLLLGPFFFVALIPLYFRYHTMRYRFDEEGVSMRWGILFRREIHLTYSRIQDIHLTSNLVERWLGLAKVQIQTASGSSKAEMTIEGQKQFQAIRDFLYARMRGMGGTTAARRESPGPPVAPGGEGDLAVLLGAVAAELRALRQELATSRGGGVARPTDSTGGEG